MRVVVILVLGIAGAAGCGASYTAPEDQFAAAQNDVGRAQQSGATNVPDARLHLQLAQEDLATAKVLMGDENARATSLIARARAEAMLAVDLAVEAKAHNEAQHADDAVTKAQASPNPPN